MLVLSLVMALPKGQMGCLMDIVRVLALVAGSVAPVGVVWVMGDKSAAWWFWALAVVSVVLGACAMGLAAFGWQTFFPGWIRVKQPKKRGRRKAGGKAPATVTAAGVAATAVPDLEQQVDLSIFDPSAYMFTPTMGSHPNQDPLGDCLFALLVGIVGGIFWVGLQLAQGIAKVLLPGMPAVETAEAMREVGSRRVARALLCFVYAVGIVVGVTAVLYFASGRAETAVGVSGINLL
jgi:hypothetical protein